MAPDDGDDVRQGSVLLSVDDTLVRSVPVVESGEPVVPVTRVARWPPHGVVTVRRGVAERLEQADRHLPSGFRLAVAEGFRSEAAQRGLYEDYERDVRRRWPEWTSARTRSEVTLYVAYPDSYAPHRSGGAVDVLLLGTEGRPVDLGTDLDATPLESEGRCYTASTDLTPAQRSARDLLCRVMTSAGFANYPSEWWHWSYGDRYWAAVGRQGHALYGALDDR